MAPQARHMLLVGLPLGAIPHPDEVPSLGLEGRMPFEACWRAATMVRLFQDHGWTNRRIGAHFGLTGARVSQLIRVAVLSKARIPPSLPRRTSTSASAAILHSR